MKGGLVRKVKVPTFTNSIDNIMVHKFK